LSATLPKKESEAFSNLRFMIGNTPMLELRYRYQGQPGRIWVKCEYYNLSGSIKDRMALHILRQAYQEGLLRRGDTIVEATSGNTGIAFAALGRALGHPVRIYMPDWLSRERSELLESMGAKVRLVSAEEGGFLRSIQLAGEQAEREKRIFQPKQFENGLNCQAHEWSTGPEIWYQLRLLGRTPDAFVAGVGTGGTIMGVGAFLRRHNPHIRLHPLEPAQSPTLSTGRKQGRHRIEGISDDFVPPILKLKELDAIVQAHDSDAIRMAQKLSAQLGLGVGFSSGANIIGAIRLQQELGPEATVVTVLPDSNKKYLSTELLWEQPLREGFISPKVEFEGYTPIRRLFGW
ncbi:PLP-dependent cysteine synthase family protein, partial [Cesiribacter andamanensis]